MGGCGCSVEVGVAAEVLVSGAITIQVVVPNLYNLCCHMLIVTRQNFF